MAFHAPISGVRIRLQFTAPVSKGCPGHRAPQELTIRTAVDFYGADKILYGTDHPCWSPHAARDVIVEAGLSEADRTRVMSTNAEAAFDLS